MQEEAQFYLNVARFHPLIVHMPIGILFFALILELLKHWKKRTDLDFSISAALLLGAASSIFAAITGWLLSEEGGYQPEALFWHKWMGISLTIGSLIALLFHLTKSEKLQRFSFPTLLITSILLIITGHLGGNITHGEDYLFTKPPEEVTLSGDINQVQVYEGLIAPILTRKCNSCHNQSKTKGDLIMTTYAGLFAGGKSGGIFDFADVENSELLKRIHLPNTDDKHMPPEGKLQLTEDEMTLLAWWIKNKACERCIVSEITEKEEVQAILDALENSEPKYDVDPLNEKDFEELRALNISVYPVAEDHPMVLINLAYRTDLDKADFKKLRSIAENVLEFNLAGSNLNDELAENLSYFKNLRKLQLQNTSISNDALKYVSELENLESLNLYQTEISDYGIEELMKLSKLEQLYLWQTKASAEFVEKLQKNTAELTIQYEIPDDIFGNNALISPEIKVSNPIFSDRTTVELSSGLNGVSIYYTTDGSNPDTTSLRYTEPFQISESLVLQSVSYKQGWRISEPSTKKLIKVGTVPKKVRLQRPPNEAYAGNGAQSLIDRKKGTQDFRDGLWLGYQGESLLAILELDGTKKVTEVVVSALSDQGSWIFYPKSIEVYVSLDGENYELAGQLDIPLLKPELFVSGMEYFEVPVDLDKAVSAKITVKSHITNPDWHSNPGEKCWLFVDEILLL
ncbi:chitobiase/beta-hexosaminidase C-terminal domain-containing protein [Ekhidna sp.]